jgi:hypothetical protein
VFTVAVVKVPVVGVVAPTVPFMFIEAVPVRLVTVQEEGVPRAPPFIRTLTPSTANCHALALESVVSVAPAHNSIVVADIIVEPRFEVLELYVRPVFVLGHKSPVAAVKKDGKQVVSVASFATVIAVGVHPPVEAIVTVPALAVPPVVKVILEPSISWTLPPLAERVTV